MPHVYGIEHFVYLFVTTAIMVISWIGIKKHVKSEDQLTKTIRIIGFLLFLAIVWNRISIAILRDGWNELLPATFCGASSLALSIAAMTLKKDHIIFHCIAYVGLMGGILTLVYPDFIGQSSSIFYPMTISGLVHHSIMFFLVMTMLMTGYLKPQLKKWMVAPVGLCIYMTYGLFLITVVGYHDAMYIYEPILEGTPLTWIVIGVIFLAYHFVFLLVFGILQKKNILRCSI
jgi:hypothetical protein